MDIAQQTDHLLIVLIVLKDVLTVDAAHHHMIDSSAAFLPASSWHNVTIVGSVANLRARLCRLPKQELILNTPNFSEENNQDEHDLLQRWNIKGHFFF